MIEVTMFLIGKSELLCHNKLMADPDNEFAALLAKINAKKKKTPEDRALASKYEFIGSLYIPESTEKEPTLGPCMPASAIVASLMEWGGLSNRARPIGRAIQPSIHNVPIQYDEDAPRTPEELFKYANGMFVHRIPVKLKGRDTRVMRTRPKFLPWALTMPAVVEDKMVGIEELKEIGAKAGRFFGIGDSRRQGNGRYDFVLKTEAELIAKREAEQKKKQKVEQEFEAEAAS